jgi:hypothetical protein
VGGYEWAVDVLALADTSGSGAMGIFVREENRSAPDGCSEFGSGGISGINAPAFQLIRSN